MKAYRDKSQSHILHNKMVCQKERIAHSWRWQDQW